MAFTGGADAQTVSTLVPFNVGDDMHYAADGYIYSSHYGGNYFRKINPLTGEVDTILNANTTTIGAIEMDDNLTIYTCSYELGWVGKFIEGDNSISNITTGLLGPAGITHDNNGNLYVATNQNKRIVKILPNGTKETFVQGSPLSWPTGITIDPDGNLFVANMFSGQIIKVSPDKQMTVLATLPAVNDQIPDVAYLTWTNDKLFICHYDKNVIYEMSPDNGDFHIVAGTGQPGHTDGPALEATFQIPTGIVASPSGDTLYVTDGVSPNQRLRMIVFDEASLYEERQEKANEFIKISPNPVQEKLTINISLKKTQSIDFQIIDANGKICLAKNKVYITSGKQEMEMDILGLAGGVYYLRAFNDQFQETVRFVKS
ncbi:MAG: T9SS type A sorting domain-containing protein [Saprospiraceae bacterium]|nr:T9SS type A sorting domain-containing protein [Saprospiraceae bacterium]